MSKNVCVIFYHRINSILFDQHSLCIPPKSFELHMRYLKNNYNILRFEDNWQDTDRDSVVVTFDDGYLDNYENAIPILDELDIPATIFVSSSYLKGDREFWWDELETILLTEDKIPEYFCLEDEQYGGCKWNTRSFDERMNCYRSIRSMMLYFADYKKRSAWMEQLWSWSRIQRHVRRQNGIITDDICRKMSEMKNITIGCHTVSHPALGYLKYEDQLWEIRESKMYLENLIEKKVDTLSYPHGSYNVDTQEICKSVGIKKAATIKEGLWNVGESLYEIPRYCVVNHSVYALKEYMENIFQK